MILIIDAYNVLKKALRTKFITESQRKSFLNHLKKYTYAKKHQAVVVFDGGIYKWPVVTEDKNITIVYTGTIETADDYIKDYLENNYAKNIALVSSDNELYSAANLYNIPTIDSSVFYTMVFSLLKKKENSTIKKNPTAPTKIYKYHQESEENFCPELDKLMESVVIKDKDQYNQESSFDIKTKQKLSKWEKKLLKIVKKL